MQGKIQVTALIACVMLVLPAAAFASDTNGTANTIPKVNTQNLQISASSTVCQINATTTYLQNVMNLNQTRFGSLNQDMTKLNGDIAILQGYISTNDSKDFKSFTQGQLKNDTRSTNLDVIHLLRSGNLTKDQSTTIESDNGQLKTANKACDVARKQQIKTLATANPKEFIAQMQLKNKKLLEEMQNRTHNILEHVQDKTNAMLEHRDNMTDNRLVHRDNMTDNRLVHRDNMTDNRLVHRENMTDNRLTHMQNMTDDRLVHRENMTDNRLAHMQDRADDRLSHIRNNTHQANPTAAYP